MKLHFLVTVWGEEYTKMFLDLCLPNQLTPGNLGFFESGPEAVYKIYTRPEDAMAISENKFFQEIGKFMKTEIHLLNFLKPSTDSAYSMSLMTRCHQIAIPESNKEDAFMVFLPPDQVYSEGAFTRLVEIGASGKGVVATPTLAMSEETFMPAFTSRFSDDNGYMSAPARDLVALALNHLHPVARSYFIDSKNSNIDTNQLYWKVNETGFIARNLLLHPLMVKPKIKTSVPQYVIDGDYPIRACPNFKDHHVVRDSDEIIACELTTENYIIGADKPRRFDIFNYAGHAKYGYNRIHNRYARKAVRIHSEDFTLEWDDVEKQTDDLIDSVRFIIATSKKYQRYEPLFNYEKDLPDLSHVKRVVIFGTGSGATAAMTIAGKCGWEAVFCVDSDEGKLGGFFEGLDIKSPETLDRNDYDLIIVSSIPWKTSMFRKLEKSGLIYGKDFIHLLDRFIVDDVLISFDIQSYLS